MYLRFERLTGANVVLKNLMGEYLPQYGHDEIPRIRMFEVRARHAESKSRI
jgi:hypothetical protein